MTVDLKFYEFGKDTAQRWMKGNSDYDVDTMVSLLACTTHVPCIVIAFWYGELVGWNKEVIDCIDRLIKSYGYTSVQNKPEGCPI